MNTTLAPNRQAEQSLDIQTVDLPQDLPLAAVQSPGTALLCRLEGGSLMTEFSDQLREVAAASYNFTKKGQISLTLDFATSGARRMDIRATIKTKIPKPDRTPTTHFVTSDGQLPVHDPEQQTINLRTVKVHDVEARVIDVPDQPTARRVA